MRRLFKPEDFEAAFGITYLDYNNVPGENDLSWRQICERAADAANDTYKYKGKIKPGIRVVASYYGERVRGLVLRTRGDQSGQLLMLPDNGNMTISVYPNQCRRLVKRKKK